MTAAGTDKQMMVERWNEEQFSLIDGHSFRRITMSWPMPLSEKEIGEVRDWLKLIERKIERATDTDSSGHEAP